MKTSNERRLAAYETNPKTIRNRFVTSLIDSNVHLGFSQSIIADKTNLVNPSGSGSVEKGLPVAITNV
jgi:hypothetical protein